jgi:hypothetical protein
MNEEQLQRLFGQFKTQILMLLNETADEFDKLDLTDEQREMYNKFTETFGRKVLNLQAHLGGEE